MFLIIILFPACSVIRKGQGIRNDNANIMTPEKVMDVTREQNISGSGFFIQKADIVFNTEDEDERVIASVKYNSNKEFLISIRNKTGIEAARIYLTPDTILINDRINREQLCASTGYLKKRYGLSLSVLPLLFGDFVGPGIMEKDTMGCIKGILSKVYEVDGIKINYLIDCKIGKILSAAVESNQGSDEIEFQYSKFVKYDKKWIPGEVQIRNLLKEAVITIGIDRISLPWDDDIEFIPGRRYETIDLL